MEKISFQPTTLTKHLLQIEKEPKNKRNFQKHFKSFYSKHVKWETDTAQKVLFICLLKWFKPLDCISLLFYFGNVKGTFLRSNHPCVWRVQVSGVALKICCDTLYMQNTIWNIQIITKCGSMSGDKIFPNTLHTF